MEASRGENYSSRASRQKQSELAKILTRRFGWNDALNSLK